MRGGKRRDRKRERGGPAGGEKEERTGRKGEGRGGAGKQQSVKVEQQKQSKAEQSKAKQKQCKKKARDQTRANKARPPDGTSKKSRRPLSSSLQSLFFSFLLLFLLFLCGPASLYRWVKKKRKEKRSMQ
ncbi:uncharacterized protein BP01DRAFT_149264 [Aspergillus saccharolyticus JOP 1030-1]|uniref:Uncharacterized protein n=1 Tax=Aspergillus saccharolyticus JOP 1030-1 TaxID=1450539 RepID=A0A318ZWM0_9EURO|nr:hypothetical protein BP01DRAFT_149264 [Aspergillus saccharolyticus JOP 1030-1]PYH48490.1 hypothetical protein BP01DRAFT_149264 [Aspergillus saccharolyticus JOP 1030-1]